MTMKTITLNEYKKEVALIKDLVREEMTSVADDEVLLVLACWRDKHDLINMGTWNEVFIDFNTMGEYISNQSIVMADGGEDEPIANRLYWEVTKYKRVDEKMVALLECTFKTDGTLLTSNEGDYFYLYDIHNERQKKICDFEYLLCSPHNIIFPYETGDILLVDALPFAKPFYVVYGGGLEKSRTLMSDCEQYHWCLYYSGVREGLKMDDLSNSCFSDRAFFYNSPLDRICRADSCNDPLIVKASKLLKEKPDLWFEWTELWIKHDMNGRKTRVDAGWLEQWIL